MNTSGRPGILQSSSKNFPGRATINCVTGNSWILSRARNKLRGSSFLLPVFSFFFFFFQAKWAVVGGSSGQLWLEWVSYEVSQCPFKIATSPCLIFSAKLKTGWPVEKGLEEQCWNRSQGFPFQDAGHQGSFQLGSSVSKKEADRYQQEKRHLRPGINLFLPQHCDRHHWDRF